jgi:hypothetical protein
VRGRLLELYLLSKIEHYKFFKATPRVIDSTKKSDAWDVTSFNFSNLIVRHFAGQKTKEPCYRELSLLKLRTIQA